MCSLMDMTQEKIERMERRKHLTCIATEIKKYTELLSDAEWEGRTDDVSFIQKQLDHYKKLMADGQIYEPKF